MQISIIGGGYVGLVSAACLASLKHDVDLIEIDQTKVTIIRDGKSPIYENGLEELLQLYINKNAADIQKTILEVNPRVKIPTKFFAIPKQIRSLVEVPIKTQYFLLRHLEN